ncbi:MAG: GTP-binding protein [Acidobacteria bacterium]|nr:MAG: GTP-binding protein [Acidobacteriota bacterium]
MLADFIVSAASPEQFPSDGLAEIAFLGRSNVGKSSLINALIGRKGLAHTSNTPGRTQTINFYRVTSGAADSLGSCYFVDFPGYGYAKVSRSETEGWKKLIESYLFNRAMLQLSLVILDARRGWMPPDLELKQWLEAHHQAYLVIATKMDKLNQSDAHRNLTVIRKSGADPLACSAVTGRGVREIWQAIAKTQHRR